AYVVDGDAIEEVVAPSSGHPDQVLERIRDAAGDRPLAMRGEGATPDALIAEVRYVHRTEGPADLASLEPQYLRPSDAKLPDEPLRTDHSS
ncbi:MAG: hypothetical protein JSV06_02020, partial [Myxococcales bacterium]